MTAILRLPQTARSFHFGISLASHIEVPILVSKITCVDCVDARLLPPLLLERMSMRSDGEAVHTRDTCTYQDVHILYSKVRVSFALINGTDLYLKP